MKKSSPYFGSVDVDVKPNFKFSQVRAVTKFVFRKLIWTANCALSIDKDEEIMDNSEGPENDELPIETKQPNKIIRFSFGEVGITYLRT